MHRCELKATEQLACHCGANCCCVSFVVFSLFSGRVCMKTWLPADLQFNSHINNPWLISDPSSCTNCLMQDWCPNAASNNWRGAGSRARPPLWSTACSGNVATAQRCNLPSLFCWLSNHKIVYYLLFSLIGTSINHKGYVTSRNPPLFLICVRSG